MVHKIKIVKELQGARPLQMRAFHPNAKAIFCTRPLSAALSFGERKEAKEEALK